MRVVILFVLQVAFCLIALAGAWMIYPPAALIIGGVGGAWIIERHPTPPAKRKPGAKP